METVDSCVGSLEETELTDYKGNESDPVARSGVLGMRSQGERCTGLGVLADLELTSWGGPAQVSSGLDLASPSTGRNSGNDVYCMLCFLGFRLFKIEVKK